MNRKQLVVLFVHGAGQYMVDNGMLEGEAFLTPRGVGSFDQLEASGFRPTEAEVLSYLDHMEAMGTPLIEPEAKSDFASLVSNWDLTKANNERLSEPC